MARNVFSLVTLFVLATSSVSFGVEQPQRYTHRPQHVQSASRPLITVRYHGTASRRPSTTQGLAGWEQMPPVASDGDDPANLGGWEQMPPGAPDGGDGTDMGGWEQMPPDAPEEEDDDGASLGGWEQMPPAPRRR